MTHEDRVHECSVLMSYGMSYEEYWHGDPRLAEYYIMAQTERIRFENRKAHLQGAYTYAALQRALHNAFIKPEDEPLPYLEEPFDIFGDKPKETEEERKERERMEVKKHFDKIFAYGQLVAKEKGFND